MKLSMLLAPRMDLRGFSVALFGYLAMATVILTITANPFQSARALDLGPKSVYASTQTVVVEVPQVQVPAAPYIIMGPSN